MAIKLIVCDIAGTTVVDKDFVSIAFVEAFLNVGIDLSVEEVKPIMGFKKTEAIEMVLKEKQVKYDEELISRINHNFEFIMVQFYATSKEIEPLPGVEEFFNFCIDRDVKVALNSGFPRKIVDVILDRLGWSENGLVQFTITSDEVEAGRPSPYMINAIMEKFIIQDSAEVLKIGDTIVDIEEGRNARCGMVVGITTGSFTRDQLEKFAPDAIIDNILDLKAYL